MKTYTIAGVPVSGGELPEWATALERVLAMLRNMQTAYHQIAWNPPAKGNDAAGGSTEDKVRYAMGMAWTFKELEMAKEQILGAQEDYAAETKKKK